MNLLSTPRGRRWTFVLLYLSEGAPIGFLWWFLPTKLKLLGLPIESVAGLLAMLALPWSFKFLWAPLIDRARTARFGFRAWIVTAQIAMAAFLVPLAWVDFKSDFKILSALLILHAFAAATQDVAIDALALGVTPPNERGTVSGWMQAGMLIGRSLFGIGLLRVASGWFENYIYLFLVVTILHSAAIVWFLCEENAPALCTPSLKDLFVDCGGIFRRLIVSRATYVGGIVALTAGAGFELVGGVVGPYIIKLLPTGTTDEAARQIVSDFYLCVVPCMIGGSIIGGKIGDRYGHSRVLRIVVGLLAMVIMTEGAAAHIGWYETSGGALLLVIYLLIGVLTACSYALFMDISDTHMKATHFSAFMGMTNMCESWSVGLGGLLIARYGYGAAFIILAALSLSSLPWIRQASELQSSSNA